MWLLFEFYLSTDIDNIIRQEQKQEKPSIRDQLRTAAKQQPEKKPPVKSKTHDMEL